MGLWSFLFSRTADMNFASLVMFSCGVLKYVLKGINKNLAHPFLKYQFKFQPLLKLSGNSNKMLLGTIAKLPSFPRVHYLGLVPVPVRSSITSNKESPYVEKGLKGSLICKALLSNAKGSNVIRFRSQLESHYFQYRKKLSFQKSK